MREQFGLLAALLAVGTLSACTTPQASSVVHDVAVTSPSPGAGGGDAGAKRSHPPSQLPEPGGSSGGPSAAGSPGEVALRMPRQVRAGELVTLRIDVTHEDPPLRFVAVDWGDGADDTSDAAQALDFIECEVGADVPPKVTERARRGHSYKRPGHYTVVATAFTSGCFADDRVTGERTIEVLPRR